VLAHVVQVMLMSQKDFYFYFFPKSLILLAWCNQLLKIPQKSQFWLISLFSFSIL